MDKLRSLLAGKVRAAATTATAVIILIDIFLPTVFDLMTGVGLVALVWYVTKGDE